MGKISPDEILLKNRRWISHFDFLKLICEKNNVGMRQAQNILNDSIRKNKKIKKHVFQDRTTIYGLDEFGPPNPYSKDNEKVDVNFITSNWDLMKSRAQKAGGFLIDVVLEELKFGDYDPITGIPKQYYVPHTIKGIIILSGAIDLQKTIGITVPENYDACILTESSAEDEDRIKWAEKWYLIRKVKEIDDGINFSYNILWITRLLRGIGVA
jgi:hypothetical protein